MSDRPGAGVQVDAPIDFQRLFEALPGIHLVATAEPDHIIVAVNDERCGATMTRRKDVIGRSLFDVFPNNPACVGEDDAGNLRASLARVVATGRVDRMALQRYDMRCPDGVFEERWWQPVNTPLPAANGKVAHILHTIEDATAAVRERRDIAAALQTEQERSHGILDSMAEGFVLLDHAFHVTEINAEGLRVDGRPREEIVGHHLLDAWPEAEHFPIWPAYRRAMAERVPVAVEYRYISDRRDLWLDVRAYPVMEGGGGLAVFYRDVTARKRIEAALRESEARLRHTVEMNPQLPWTADPRGRITGFSQRWLDVTGLTRDAAMGEGWMQVPHPDDRERMGAAWLHAVDTGEGYDVEARLRMADGSYRWWRARAAARRGATGAIVEWHGQTEDIHDRKRVEEALRANEAALRHANEVLEARVAERTAELSQAVDALYALAAARAQAEEALRQSQKMEAVGQLTGGIAHDFNNMLQAIGGNLEMLERRLEQGRAADAARSAATARRTVERAAALTHRLLAFARRQALQPRPVEPGELVRGMADLVRQTMGPSVVVELHLGDGVWGVLCDPGQLENVLLNLAVNARDAMPGDGRLTFSTRNVSLSPADVVGQDGAVPGDHVEIAVADTGMGMDEATKARAFEPFFTTKPIGQGTGLGLSQAYGFVRQSGGAVRLDSAPGRGTTVRLYLPRHRAAIGAGQDGPGKIAADTRRAAGGEVLLVVEDEADVRAAAAEHLRDLGYQVLEAGDGPAALRLLREAPRVDLLVSDVGLPGGLNGRQVADAARERRPGLPVLFITGYAGTFLDGELAPDMAVLGKPFALDALAARTRAMLEAAPAI